MGHSHEVVAATPEDLAGPAELAPRAPLWRTLALGGLCGAAFGAAEVAWRMHAELTPSIGRRAPELVLETAAFYALAGALLTALLTPVSRLLGATYARGFQRGLAGLSFLALAGAAFAAALASRAALPPGPAPTEPVAGARNLILIVVDTLRADALGTYGAARATPNMDGLAERGARFEEVVAPSSWTLPSMASLFTATYPRRHRYVDFDGSIDEQRVPELAHLAEVLSSRGWDCRAVVGNTLLDPEGGFARGFSFYDTYDFKLQSKLLLNWTATRALRALGVLGSAKRVLVPVLSGRFPFVDTRLAFYNLDEDLTERVFRHALPRQPAEPPRPLFLYVHYLAPHTPYLAHPHTRSKRAPEPRDVPPDELHSLYLGEVAYTDAQVGRLLEGLATRGWLEDSIVCLTADHGEAFSEHDRYEHGRDLHREALRVPWLLAGPGVPAGTRHAAPVSLVDLAPTLLELLGVPAPEGFEGRSRLPALTGANEDSAPVFAETSSRYLTPDARHTGVFDGQLRLLRVRDTEGQLVSEQLFDLENDPGEQRPLADHAEQQALAAALDTYAQRGEPEPEAGSAADLEAMRALGYTEGDAGDGDGD